MLSIHSPDYVCIHGLVSIFMRKTHIHAQNPYSCAKPIFMRKTHNHFWSTMLVANDMYVSHGRMNLRLQHCLGTSVARHKPHKKLGNEANPFSQQAIPFLPLTRHAAKQTSSYLNRAVETAGDAKKIYPEDRYILTFCLSLGHRLCYLSVCPLVISYTSYLSRGSKQVISVPGSKGILVCLSYGGVGDDLVNKGCILIYLFEYPNESTVKMPRTCEDSIPDNEQTVAESCCMQPLACKTGNITLSHITEAPNFQRVAAN